MFTFICRTPLLRKASGDKYGKTTTQKEALKTILSKVFTAYFPKVWRDVFWEERYGLVSLGDSKVFVDDNLEPMFFIEVRGMPKDNRWEQEFAALFEESMIRFFVEATTAYTAKFTLWADDQPYLNLPPDLLKEYLPFTLDSGESIYAEGFRWWIV